MLPYHDCQHSQVYFCAICWCFRNFPKCPDGSSGVPGHSSGVPDDSSGIPDCPGHVPDHSGHVPDGAGRVPDRSGRACFWRKSNERPETAAATARSDCSHSTCPRWTSDSLSEFGMTNGRERRFAARPKTSSRASSPSPTPIVPASMPVPSSHRSGSHPGNPRYPRNNPFWPSLASFSPKSAFLLSNQCHSVREAPASVAEAVESVTKHVSPSWKLPPPSQKHLLPS